MKIPPTPPFIAISGRATSPTRTLRRTDTSGAARFTRSSPTATASTTWPGTSGNGAPIGIARTPTHGSAKGLVTNPTGPDTSLDPDEPYTPKHVIRGGSFLCNASYCSSYRVAARMKSSADSSTNHTGFRCVMTP